MTAGAASHSLCDLGRVYFPLWACFLKAKTPLSGNSSQQVAGSFHFPGPQGMPPAPPPGLAIVHNDGRGGGSGASEPLTGAWATSTMQDLCGGAPVRSPPPFLSLCPLLFLLWKPAQADPSLPPRSLSLASGWAGGHRRPHPILLSGKLQDRPPSPPLGNGPSCPQGGGCWEGRRRSGSGMRTQVERLRASALCGWAGE